MNHNQDQQMMQYLFIIFLCLSTSIAHANPELWQSQWPLTDFRKHNVDFEEIIPGGPAKDGIPPIDKPTFFSVSMTKDIPDMEPVITLNINDDARAYPLRYMIYHEIVNDYVGGTHVAITYCPLCNSSIVFDRSLGDDIFDFGTTGMLRKSDLVMYDRQTESWWQQFTGKAIIGTHAGKILNIIPSRLESYKEFKTRYPHGEVLTIAEPQRPYGKNPYLNYDSAKAPYLYIGNYDDPTPPMARVVAIGKEAWPLVDLRENKKIETDRLVITWKAGQSSALDTEKIADGKDVGTVVVQRKTKDGLVDEAYVVTFAFAFKAFLPEGVIHHIEKKEAN